MPTTEEAIDLALNAIVQAIINVLQGSDNGRFAEASKLCTVAQSVQRAKAKRVEDFAALEGDPNARVGFGVYQANNRINIAPGGAVDEREVQRNFMLTFGGNAQIHAEAQRATLATQEVLELQALSELRYQTGVPAMNETLDARIRTLLHHIEVRNNAESNVADPVVPRGHQTGEAGAEEDAAPCVQPDGGRGAGDEQAPIPLVVPVAAG